jgi:TPR repeat protein
MPPKPSRALLAVCAIIATTLPALAQNPTFADLLARAQAQAAAGHRWTPAGDNMTETVMRMMDLIPTATPEQLTQLSDLLESDKARPPRGAPEPDAATEETRAKTSPERTPSDDTPPAPPAADTTVPVRPAPPAADIATALAVRPIPQIATRVAPPPGPRAIELFGRGQQAELRGDVSGARRFYSAAAQQGHATAARDLGRLYDPGYLKQTALGGIDADPAMARHWYEQAIAMGDAEAGPLLEALSLR